MDLTIFEYILDVPAEITNELWFELAVRSYNLGLTFFWFMILRYVTDKIFIALNKSYHKGHD